MLLNLISNARRNVQKIDGIIRFESSITRNDGQVFLYISVINNGPDNDQVDNNDNQNPFSNGIGLNICKLICQSLGGNIELRQNKNTVT